MTQQHVVIIGGGLAGLSAGCYARASGYRTTILEHNLALGGVCTAWRRGPYVVDGCIHWLTGGPFTDIYRELGILPAVELRTLETFTGLRDERDGIDLAVTSDLPALAAALAAISPEDRSEIDAFVDGARHIADLSPPFDKPRDLYGLRDGMTFLWHLRGQLGHLVHFRGSMNEYVERHIKSERLRRVLTGFMSGEVPAVFALMVLGYLSRGWLSRPVGGTAAFRDALIDSYRNLGGEVRLSTTVDEILVENDRARGVRLFDGSMIPADVVISTSSIPETVFRLLGGRYDAKDNQERMRSWKMFTPIVLASFGVELPLAGYPGMLQIQGIEPFMVGGTANDRLYLRICNDDPSLAPAGHAVVQAMLQTDYAWWAERGTGYQAAKDAVLETALETIDRYLPGVRAACRMADAATPLTYWHMARSWRGAFEGWMPSGGLMNTGTGIGHRLDGLTGLYLAGQWVEPGGGVPTACHSGRQAVQLLCDEQGTAFQAPQAASVPPGPGAPAVFRAPAATEVHPH